MPPLSRRTCLSLTLASIVSTSARAQVPPISTEQFNAWIRLRGGEDTPAYWYSAGLIWPIKDEGAVAGRMVGLETWITPPDLRTETSAVSLSRKLFFFLAPDRDELVTNPRTGKPQRPSTFAYQVRKFTLVDGRINYDVESHDLRGIRQGGKGVTYTVNAHDNQVHVNYASFPRRTGPDGNMRVNSGEIYDYFDNGSQITEEPSRYQMTWVGTNLEGRIANLRGWRYATLDDLPNTWLKEIVVDKAPLWTAPPKDLSEVETLRATVPYPVPGLPV
jgi:hypothetical protein